MKLLDKLINNIRFDRRYVFFMLVIVILGIITGSLFIIILNSSDKMLVKEYIEKFITNIDTNNLYNNLMLNYSSVVLISIIGFTYFLFPLNILILFYKSFVIGFSISSLIMVYKIKGVLLSIVYIIPHHILNILFLSLLTAFTAKLSIMMINHIIKKQSVDLRKYLNKYLCMLLVISILFIFTTLYETYIIPHLIKFLTSLLHI